MLGYERSYSWLSVGTDFQGIQLLIYRRVSPIHIPNIGRVPKKVKNETIQVYSYPLIIPFRKWIRLLIHFLIDGYILIHLMIH
jgi:hypothetical protein